VPEDLPAVPGDPVGLRQVLLNLLENAIDASSPTGTIVVRGSLVPRQNGRGPQVELSVRDPGYGMSPEEIRLAFQPFYTTKASDRGTGLGLVIVDYIVRAHGGRLDLESAPGEGTTIRVFLPVEV
jgi:signal transduction histidine kinase